MTTRGTMQARIRRELRVGTRLDADIPDAINTAIDAYAGERFSWAESRTACVFNTVADTEFYDQNSAGASALARLIEIDWVSLVVGNSTYELRDMRPDAAEWIGVTTAKGQPFRYSWYEEKLRLWPIPNGVYPIRVAGLFRVAPPADDNEAGNPWMTTAETLIRCRAKAELARHRMQEAALAEAMDIEAAKALSILIGKTVGRIGTGCLVPFW
jgi:hypothetical protein